MNLPPPRWIADSATGAELQEGLAVSTDVGAEIIKAENVTKRFGELIAVDRVTYALRENEVAGIVGSNGAGKTTFFNLVNGSYSPDEGGEEIEICHCSFEFVWEAARYQMTEEMLRQRTPQHDMEQFCP